MAVMNRLYCCYGVFVYLLLLSIVLRFESIVVTVLDKDVINMAFLNYYGQKIDKYWFCYLCFDMVKQKKVPKFSFINKIKVIICQDYLFILEALILVEENLLLNIT